MNEYNNPAQAQFMNTYVPIPFNQLYQLGMQAKQDVETATSQLGNTISKWSEFTSPSQADTQTWYNETIGKAKPLINEMANNMDLMKSPEGRARINSIINNIDTSKLAAIKQSAINLGERQKLNQQLMLAGRYNPDWHNVDFANYNTAQKGVYDDLTPLAYKSVAEIANPYFNDLKDHFINQKGAYDYVGITQGDIENVAKSKFNDIYNTPEAQRHMQSMMQKDPNLTLEGAQQNLYKEVLQSQQDKVRSNREVNQLYLTNLREGYANARAAASRATKGSGSGISGVATLTDKLRVGGVMKFGEQMGKYYNLSPEQAYRSMRHDASTTFNAHAFNTPYVTDKMLSSKKYNAEQLGRGSQALMKKFSWNAGTGAVQSVINGMFKVGKNQYSVDTSKMMLPTDFASGMLGLGDQKDPFLTAFRQGKFEDVSVSPTSEVITDGNNEYARVKVTIPGYSLVKSGIKDYKTFGKKYLPQIKEVSNEVSSNISSNSIKDGIQTTVIKQNISSKAPLGQQKYHNFTIDALIPINRIKGTTTEELVNHDYNTQIMTSAGAGKLAPSVEADTYDYLNQ